MSNVVLCPVCGGTGKITLPPNPYWVEIPQPQTCHGCGGLGWVEELVEEIAKKIEKIKQAFKEGNRWIEANSDDIHVALSELGYIKPLPNERLSKSKSKEIKEEKPHQTRTQHINEINSLRVQNKLH